MVPLFMCSLLSLLLLTRAGVDDDRPHGLADEPPMMISPAMYDFFHSDDAMQPSPYASSSNSDDNDGLAIAAASTVQSTPGTRSTSSPDGHGPGAGGLLVVYFSFVLICLAGMGVYRVMTSRMDGSQQPTSTA